MLVRMGQYSTPSVGKLILIVGPRAVRPVGLWRRCQERTGPESYYRSPYRRRNESSFLILGKMQDGSIPKGPCVLWGNGLRTAWGDRLVVCVHKGDMSWHTLMRNRKLPQGWVLAQVAIKKQRDAV